jgi:hypothetical protein
MDMHRLRWLDYDVAIIIVLLSATALLELLVLNI